MPLGMLAAIRLAERQTTERHLANKAQLCSIRTLLRAQGPCEDALRPFWAPEVHPQALGPSGLLSLLARQQAVFGCQLSAGENPRGQKKTWPALLSGAT